LLNSPSKALGIQCPMQLHKNGNIGFLITPFRKLSIKGIEPSPCNPMTNPLTTAPDV